MNIHALISWYDEPDEWLQRAILSIAPLVDHVIALDGRYRRFQPEAPASSPRSNREAIRQACHAAGVELTMPEAQVWPTQCEKRTEMFRLAEQAGVVNTAEQRNGDWLLVIDADEYAIHLDAAPLRHALETTRSHTCMVGWEILEYDVSDDELALQRCAVEARRQRFRRRGIPQLYRLLPNMMVGPTHHWLYAADGYRGQRVALKGGRLQPGLRRYTTTSVAPHLVMASDTLARSMDRKLVKADYYDERKRVGEDL